jgi:hypothetical protein
VVVTDGLTDCVPPLALRV